MRTELSRPMGVYFLSLVTVTLSSKQETVDIFIILKIIKDNVFRAVYLKLHVVVFPSLFRSSHFPLFLIFVLNVLPSAGAFCPFVSGDRAPCCDTIFRRLREIAKSDY